MGELLDSSTPPATMGESSPRQQVVSSTSLEASPPPYDSLVLSNAPPQSLSPHSGDISSSEMLAPTPTAKPASVLSMPPTKSSSKDLTKADKKAEKADKAAQKQAEKDARQAEKDKAKQDKKNKKARLSLSQPTSPPSTSSNTPTVPHTSSVSASSITSPDTSLTNTASKGKEALQTTSPRSRAAEPSSSDQVSEKLTPAIPPKPIKRDSSLSPRGGDVATSKPSEPAVVPVIPPRRDLVRSPSVLTIGQSSLLNQIGQKTLNRDALQLLNRPKQSSPFYRLVLLESDVKPLTEQSTAGDFPILIQEDFVRLMNDFGPESIVPNVEPNLPPDLHFEKLSRLAIPSVGLHGNKEEMVAFLHPRVPKLNEDLWTLFDKPGIYALVGNSLPSASDVDASITSSSTSSSFTAKKSSKKSSPTQDTKRLSKLGDPSSSGQLTLFVVLWHTSDAYLQMFTTNNRSLQMFAFVNALTSYRIALYSELEARHLIRLESELITSRQDITSIKTLPATIRDPQIQPVCEGGVVFGKTNTISIDKYLLNAILSTGTFGDSTDVYGLNGANLPQFEFLAGSHSISYRIVPRDSASSSSSPPSSLVAASSSSSTSVSHTPTPTSSSSSRSQDVTMMGMAVESVPNLLAQWGSNGSIDLSEMNDEEFDLLLLDGQAPDWKQKSLQIASELSRVESLVCVPRFADLDSLLDAVIRAHLRTIAQVNVLDAMFEQTVQLVPETQRLSSFSSSGIDDASLTKHDAKADQQLLNLYAEQLQVAAIAPETPYLVALSRLALAKSALRLVRVLKNKSPDDQISFIINTMDSSQDEVNQLYTSLQGYPEFEKTHHNFFQSCDLRTETDPRIRWYFISLYDNMIVQTRQIILKTLAQTDKTLDKLQPTHTNKDMAAFAAWKADLIKTYRSELNARLKSIFDFKLGNMATNAQQQPQQSKRNVVIAYKRDPSGKSVVLHIKPIVAASPKVSRAKTPQTEDETETTSCSLINFVSSNWLVPDSPPSATPSSILHPKNNLPHIRISATACKTFSVPTNSRFVSSHHSAPSGPSLNTDRSSSDPDCTVHVFYASNLNVVITVLSRKSKRETQIFAAGGSLVGTLPVYCSRVAYCEESLLLALCGEYVQLYRLLDGCKALSTIPFVSFYLDPKAYGTLEQVHVVGETCYFFTSTLDQSPYPIQAHRTGLNGPNAPALPPRPDLVGVVSPGSSLSATSKVCHIFKASSSGMCIRLSPPQGISPFDSLLVFPSQSHLLLVRESAAKGLLVGELWHLAGLTVSVFLDIELKAHPPRSSATLRLVSLHGSLHLVSSSGPMVAEGRLNAKLHFTRLDIIDPSAEYAAEVEASKVAATRKVQPCENYLTYFAEAMMKYTPSPAIATHQITTNITAGANTQQPLNVATKPLRVLVSTANASIFMEFDNYVDRQRTMLRFAMLSTEKLQVRGASKSDLYMPMSQWNMMNNSSSSSSITSSKGASSSSQQNTQTSTSGQSVEPMVPYLHHTLIKTKQTNHFATREYDDLAEEASLFSMASLARILICAIPMPIISSTPRGILVACTDGGRSILPYAEVMAMKSAQETAASPSALPSLSLGARVPSPASNSSKLVPIPNLIQSKLSFGIVESLIQNWKAPVKIVTSFGGRGTGKSTLLNHVFGTYFESSSPFDSPMFNSSTEATGADATSLQSGSSCPVGAFLSVVPSPTAMYLVIDFESILSQKPAAEQVLLSVLNFGASNLTLWRSATPFLDEHFETLRDIALEKERLVAWSQNVANQPLLPWPKSYNSLVVASDTSRVTELLVAKKSHYDLAKSSIKHFEGNPGPNAKPVLNSMVRNRFAAVALPLSMRANMGTHLAVNPKCWKLGPLHTKYIHQNANFYQALNDDLAPFLDPIICFDSGSEALSHLKRHLSYILWSQTSLVELPPRLEEVVAELELLSTNALIFGQQIRHSNANTSSSKTGTVGGSNATGDVAKSSSPASLASTSTSPGPGKGTLRSGNSDYVPQKSESQVTKEGETIRIDPLGDLSDPSKVVGCPMLDFALLGIPEPITLDFQRLQQYFPEEGLVLPIGSDPLPFNPQSKQEWSYYSFVDVILLWNRHVCSREHVVLESDWMMSLQLFLNMLISRRALRVDFWLKLHIADILATSSLHRKVVVLREKLATNFEKIKCAWKLCGKQCSNCYYMCTLHADHPGNHDCLVPQQHKCTSKCPKCQKQCPIPAGHRRDGILHKCPVGCQRG